MNVWLWLGIGVTITLGLVARVTVVQANNLPNEFASLPALELNQIFSMVNKPMISVNVTATPSHLSAVEKDLGETTKSVLNLKEYANSTNLTSQILGQHYYVDISEVLRQFDRVDAELLKAISMFSTPYISLENEAGQVIKARSMAGIFDKRPTCTVSKDSLDELKTVIETALSTNNLKQSDVNCKSGLEQSNSDNSDCDMILEIIMCGVANLKEGFLNLMRDSISKAEYDKLKNINDELFEKLERLEDNLRVESDQAIKEVVDKYQTQIANLQLTIKELRKTMRGYTIKLCVSEIHSGRITQAFNYFKELKDDSELSTIITNSYDYLSNLAKNDDKLNNFENIMQFRLKLPRVNQTTLVFQSLFNAMERNYHLDSPKVLLLDRAIKEVIEGNCCLDKDIKNALTSLRSKLAPRITNIIGGWATRVRTYKEYAQIKDFALKYDRSTDYFSQLVEKAYANNLGNAQTIINFIQGFGYSYIEQHIIGYSTLFEQMRKNSHFDSSEIIKLAYFIKQFMDNNNYYMSNDNRNNFTNLKNKFPNAIRGLIWSGSCHIKNKYWGEYLYAANDNNAYDKQRRNVFTWRPGGKVAQGSWKFEPVDNATSFKIKNNAYSNYLYADGGKFYNKERRYAFTWRSGGLVTEVYWKLESINQATIFRLKNVAVQEYLYAAADNMAYNKERRRIFTWVARAAVREGDWILEC